MTGDDIGVVDVTGRVDTGTEGTTGDDIGGAGATGRVDTGAEGTTGDDIGGAGDGIGAEAGFGGMLMVAHPSRPIIKAMIGRNFTNDTNLRSNVVLAFTMCLPL
jgi:hypothetical protein